MASLSVAGALVLSCSTGTVVLGGDAGLQPCTDDNECPAGSTCSGGLCQPAGGGDAGVDRAAPAKMLVSPTVLDFGNPYAGGEYVRTLTITNAGVADLTVQSLNLVEDRTTGAFLVTSRPVPFSIPGSLTETITVTLRPNDANLPTGSIKVHSDDPDPASADATVDLVSHLKGSGLLGVCVLNETPPPDCAVSGDGNPLIDYGLVEYGSATERVVALTNAGDGNLPLQITQLSLPNPAHFTVTLFEAVDDPANPGQTIEQPAVLPFFLSIGDATASPPLPATELRVHLQFTATGVDGDVPHESLVVEYNLGSSPTTIPIVGRIHGCMPTATDAGVPDGAADPDVDPNNCGACGIRCDATIAHAAVTCTYGTCDYSSCAASWGDCDYDRTNGCETDTRTSLGHCGACDAACTNLHAIGSTCVSGGCTAPSCDTNYGNCDADNANGCETDLRVTVDHCGSCTTVCRQISGHGTNRCIAGLCTPTCAPGYKDCDGDPDNGCEASIRTDVSNCGDCGTVCDNSAGTTSCVGGICHPGCDSGFGDCDGVPTNGCETNILGDEDNCGGCGASFTCSAQNVPVRTCTDGTCSGECTSSFADCNNNKLVDGCETDLRSDPNNCGGCGRVCSGTNIASRTCVNGVCNGTCSAGYADCDNDKLTNGCEVQLAVDPNNCGACNSACSNSHMATRLCAGSQCVGACAAGYADCNADKRNDGCEADLKNDPYTCGGCGNNCSANHMATKTCTAGVCTGACVAGFADCDGSKLTNGCEADLNGDPNTCGACTNSCSGNHVATRHCTSGVCDGTCSSGFADCNGNKLSDGCEGDLKNDPNTCGACTQSCSSNHVASRSCTGGVCSGTCAVGYADCDGNKLSNGCEVNTTSAVAHCGGCNQTCSAANGTATCAGSTCAIACTAGFGNCDGDARSNGCEVNLKTDPLHCNSCPTVCSSNHGTASCTNGACGIACDANWDNCDVTLTNGCEADLTNDASHCGNCTTVCNASGGTPSCNNGTCGISCTAPMGDCDGNVTNGCETNLNTTVAHCGGCGHACSTNHGTASCANGQCQIACAAGWGNCDGNIANGCETNLTSTAAHCGACGAACSAQNGTRSCSASQCLITCNPGWGNCDGDARTNGCETNLTNTVAHCGACNSACSGQNGTAACAASQCSITCNAGYGDCNSNPRLDGCETNTTNTPAHCGGCGASCNSTNGSAGCSGSNCTIACNAGWGNCDGDARANGCETNTTNTVAHCGQCGHNCGSDVLAHVAAVGCAASTCTVTSCQGGYYNPNGTYADGCECAADAQPKSCTAAANLGTLAVDVNPPLTVTGYNLTPTPGDADWYKVTFLQNNTCNFGPKITVSGDPQARVKVYTSCTSGVAGGAVACSAGGNSSAPVVSWEYKDSAAASGGCGLFLTHDPRGGFSSGFNPAYYVYGFPYPVTVYVQVVSLASTITCAPYTLTFTN